MLANVYANQYQSGARRTPETRRAAYRAARRAVELAPDLPETHLGLAYLHFSDGDHAESRREVELAAIGLPNSPARLHLLGGIDQRDGRWAESQAAFERAFELDPVATAEILAIHPPAPATVCRRPALRRARDGVKPVRRGGADGLGAVQRTRRRRRRPSRTRGGARCAITCRRARPRSAGAARMVRREVRPRTAVDWRDGRVRRLAAGELPLSAALAAAQVYESQGRRADAAASYAAAWELLQRRRKVLGDDFQVEAAMGLTAAGLGRVDEALHHANRAVSLLPITTDAAGGPLYLYLLAQTQARVGRPAEAMATLDRLLRVPGFYTEVWVERDPGFATVRARPEYRARREYWATLKGDALLVARNP